jgi:hypothetical protein
MARGRLYRFYGNKLPAKEMHKKVFGFEIQNIF